MDTTGWIILIVVVLLLVGLGLFLFRRQRQTRRLEGHYGSEYDRAVDESDSRRDAEQELIQREERRDELDIQELEPAERDRYREEWRTVQQRFVDEPRGAVVDADRLVTAVMRDRGYPVDDFDQRAADVSVDHPGVVEDYRSAHDIAVRVEDNRAGTEDLRQAVVHYRSLFEQLLDGRSQ